jgi:hypothetical protein
MANDNDDNTDASTYDTSVNNVSDVDGTPGVLGPLPTLKHNLSASAPGHWQPAGSHCAQAVSLVEPLDVLDSPDIPGADIPGVTLARVPSGSAMISVLSFNSRDSLGVIRLVSFPGVLILGPSLL